MLVQAGVSVRTAQEILRHVDPRTTMRVYAHVQGADRLDAVAKLAAYAASGPAEQAAAGG
jgi:integrase